MKVVIVNNSDSLGGAAIVSRRLMHALRDAGVDTRMLVLNKSTDDPAVAQCCGKTRRFIDFALERLRIMAGNGFNRRDLFNVSLADTGCDISRHPWIREADIVALNWINQGMLSLADIKRLHRAGKKIVWTMHDMWCLTGVCHHAHRCTRYTDRCGHCPYLHDGRRDRDLSRTVWKRKSRLYASVPIHFVPVSNWLAGKCRESSLLQSADVTVIPNAFPTADFNVTPSRPGDKLPVTPGRNIILMGAARLDDPIKGLDYAIDALNIIARAHPEVAAECEAVFFGAIRNPQLLERLEFPYRHLGMITDSRLVSDLYAASRIILSTSLYETLPGTLIEGMAGGCIPVSFAQGGQADIFTHLDTGYMAQYKSPQSVAEGILWALKHDITRNRLHDEVVTRFSAEAVARRYIALFNRILQH